MASHLHIAVIGGGPSGLMVADRLAPYAEVCLYEHGKHIGRKFLVAGQGGFNLTNEAVGDALLQHYSPRGFLDRALTAFGPEELRAWLMEMGIGTYIGTSGRVFPAKGIKPIDVLTRIRERIVQRGTMIHAEHAFTGFTAEGKVRLEHAGGDFILQADRVIFALGGCSWPVTGSTGIWPALFAAIGLETLPFQASNCGVEIDWPPSFIRAHEGKPLKNLRVSAGEMTALGEATITRHGLEGNVIYPVIPAFRKGATELRLDLKPDNSVERLLERIGARTPRNFGEALHLNRTTSALLKAFTPKEASALSFARHVKELRIPVRGLRPTGESISTVGGISPKDLNPDFSFKRFPQFYAIGEMVDWDAPTGGFLLQGCFAMGHWAGTAIAADAGRPWGDSASQ